DMSAKPPGSFPSLIKLIAIKLMSDKGGLGEAVGGACVQRLLKLCFPRCVSVCSSGELLTDGLGLETYKRSLQGLIIRTMPPPPPQDLWAACTSSFSQERGGQRKYRKLEETTSGEVSGPESLALEQGVHEVETQCVTEEGCINRGVAVNDSPGGVESMDLLLRCEGPPPAVRHASAAEQNETEDPV
ncbi:Centrosomal protein of 120 kDa, partial [Dissostichus eleginoides]